MLKEFIRFVSYTATALLIVPTVSLCSPDLLARHLSAFYRVDGANPILEASSKAAFFCPLQNKTISWESDHVFNPAAVVRNQKVYLIYRAEDDYGRGVGKHTSRIGLAFSDDGVHFTRHPEPVLFPSDDDQKEFEFPGGCEDPRVVETDDGLYVMTYTQWNQKTAVLAVATSRDLLTWKKHGYVFKDDFDSTRVWSKSGSIVCRKEGDRLVATKINGKYWMYWGEGTIQAATSDDLISWKRVVDKNNQPVHLVEPRKWKFDSNLVEPGPPAIVTRDGIVLLYNGKNDIVFGDMNIASKAYSAGQLIFDANDPTQIISRSEKPFLTPQNHHEKNGQYTGGTVFIQGLVPFNGRWFLYYGTADSAIGVATNMEHDKEL